MGGKNRVFAAELHKHTDSLSFSGCVRNVSVAYAGEFGYLLRDMESGVDFGVERVHHLQVFQLDSADLGQAVVSETQSGSLNVEHDDLIAETAFIGGFQDKFPVDIVDHIRLTAVDDLEVLGHIVHTVRERLHTAVVGYRHSLMTPFSGSCDERYRVGNSVHSRHIRMTVQFDTLFGVVILFGNFLHFEYG